MNDSRFSTGVLKDTATDDEILALRRDIAQAQRGHRSFPWWALRDAIEEWKKRAPKKEDRAS